MSKGELPMGVRYYLWTNRGRLYITLKRGPIRRTVYLGLVSEEAAVAGEAGPCKECMELLRELAEAYNEAVQIAKKALREGQTKEDYREALSLIAYAPKALREALEMVGYAEE